MSACATLLASYQEWRKCTHAEGEAILEGDWPAVKRCQATKAELQPRILKETLDAQQECERDGINRPAFDRQVRSLVNELIFLETRNGEMLAEQNRALREEHDALQRSGRNLNRIHKQYRSGSATAWESYS
jgi:hypothetical protein